MKVDETVRESLISALREHVRRFSKKMNDMIDKMHEAKTVEEIMRIKRDMLKEWVREMPTKVEDCYFCVLYDFATDNVEGCGDCPYGKHHGICTERGSDYDRILNLRDELIRAIHELYYSGEEYEPF